MASSSSSFDKHEIELDSIQLINSPSKKKKKKKKTKKTPMGMCKGFELPIESCPADIQIARLLKSIALIESGSKFEKIIPKTDENLKQAFNQYYLAMLAFENEYSIYSLLNFLNQYFTEVSSVSTKWLMLKTHAEPWVNLKSSKLTLDDLYQHMKTEAAEINDVRNKWISPRDKKIMQQFENIPHELISPDKIKILKIAKELFRLSLELASIDVNRAYCCLVEICKDFLNDLTMQHINLVRKVMDDWTAIGFKQQAFDVKQTNDVFIGIQALYAEWKLLKDKSKKNFDDFKKEFDAHIRWIDSRKLTLQQLSFILRVYLIVEQESCQAIPKFQNEYLERMSKVTEADVIKQFNLTNKENIELYKNRCCASGISLEYRDLLAQVKVDNRERIYKILSAAILFHFPRSPEENFPVLEDEYRCVEKLEKRLVAISILLFDEDKSSGLYKIRTSFQCTDLISVITLYSMMIWLADAGPLLLLEKDSRSEVFINEIKNAAHTFKIHRTMLDQELRSITVKQRFKLEDEKKIIPEISSALKAVPEIKSPSIKAKLEKKSPRKFKKNPAEMLQEEEPARLAKEKEKQEKIAKDELLRLEKEKKLQDNAIAEVEFKKATERLEQQALEDEEVARQAKREKQKARKKVKREKRLAEKQEKQVELNEAINLQARIKAELEQKEIAREKLARELHLQMNSQLEQITGSSARPLILPSSAESKIPEQQLKVIECLEALDSYMSKRIPHTNYAIVGSFLLYLTGIVESINDIDLRFFVAKKPRAEKARASDEKLTFPEFDLNGRQVKVDGSIFELNPDILQESKSLGEEHEKERIKYYEDARQRDFTLNSVYLDRETIFQIIASLKKPLQGTADEIRQAIKKIIIEKIPDYLDPTGYGREDFLKPNPCIRTVSEAFESPARARQAAINSMTYDPKRIIRLAMMVARNPKLVLSPILQEAMQQVLRFHFDSAEKNMLQTWVSGKKDGDRQKEFDATKIANYLCEKVKGDKGFDILQMLCEWGVMRSMFDGFAFLAEIDPKNRNINKIGQATYPVIRKDYADYLKEISEPNFAKYCARIWYMLTTPQVAGLKPRRLYKSEDFAKNPILSVIAKMDDFQAELKALQSTVAVSVSLSSSSGRYSPTMFNKADVSEPNLAESHLTKPRA